jgi:hypothetical protein
MMNSRKPPTLEQVRKWYFRWIEEYERTGFESCASQALQCLMLAYIIYDEQ